MQLEQAFADFVRQMTRLDGQRLRDLIGDDDLKKFAELLGVDIEVRREYQVDRDYLDRAAMVLKDNENLEAENATLIKQVRALSGSVNAVGVVGATITLRSGNVFDYLVCDPNTFTIEDIAWALAKEGRYANQLPGDLVFNVAQHSCIIHDRAPREYKLEALMHDSPEFVVKDVPKPLKMLLGPGYAAAEERVWLAICRKWRMNPRLPSVIKALDWRMLNTEKQHLTADKRHDWNGLNDHPPFEDVTVDDLMPWSIERSAEEFLKRFHAEAEDRGLAA